MKTILTVNAGSSSLKLSVLSTCDQHETRCFNFVISGLNDAAYMRIKDNAGKVVVEAPLRLEKIDDDEKHLAALMSCLDWLGNHYPAIRIDAVGHRVVHGGNDFTEPCLITTEVTDSLSALIPLAPLHQPYNIKLIELCRHALKQVPQVACFDTMFHRTQPEIERNYALPTAFTEQGIKRYGFHGLSYEFIMRQLAARHVENKSTIICHLGAGASMCAIKQGQSIASTMGFTATDGLPMATRCGNLDPGVVLYLMRHHHLSINKIERLLNKESGLLGMSGLSGDMKVLKQSASPQAAHAIDVFAYRIALEVGRLTAALEGLQQIVFTGGIGENDAQLRAKVLKKLGYLGVFFDASKNEVEKTEPAYSIHSQDSLVDVRVIETDEEAMIARHTRDLLHLV